MQYVSNLTNSQSLVNSLQATIYTAPFPGPGPTGAWTSNTTWIDFSDPFGYKRQSRLEADRYGFINWEE